MELNETKLKKILFCKKCDIKIDKRISLFRLCQICYDKSCKHVYISKNLEKLVLMELNI